MFLTLPLILSLGLLGAHHDSDEEPSLEYALRLELDDPLLSYSWGGRARVPANFRSPAALLSYGEAGVTSWTRSYLSLNEGRGAAPADSVDQLRRLEGRGLEWTQGRFAAGTRLTEDDSFLRIEGDENLLTCPLTIAFWFRPESLDGKDRLVLSLDRTFELRQLENGELELVWSFGPTKLKAPLLRERWNHVAVIIDDAEFPEIRLVVNDVVVKRVLGEAPEVVDAAESLVFGAARGSRGARMVLDEIRIEGRALATAELIRRTMEAPTAGFHELELVFRSGVRTVPVWYGTVRQPRLETADDLANGALRFAVAEGDGLRRVEANWERLETEHAPRARTTHPTLYVGDGRVFIFGGEVRDSHGWAWRVKGDTWLFHPESATWEEVVSTLFPAPRCHQDSAFSPDHRMVFYPGGWRNDLDPTVSYDDLWCFFPDEARWERRKAEGPPLGNTSDSSVVYDPDRGVFLILKAGQLRIFAYDPATNQMSLFRRVQPFAADGGETDYRFRASMMSGYDPDSGQVLLYGGSLGTPADFYAETAFYDPETNQCRLIETTQSPSPRVRSGFAYDSKRKRFVLFGGVQGQESQRMEDLWVFDPKERDWRELESSNPPSRRGGYYGMAYDPDADRFYLLLGRHSLERFLAESWALEMNDDAVGEAVYTFDRKEFAALDTFELRGESPGDSAIDVHFRSSPNLHAWPAWPAWSDSTGSQEDRYLQVRLGLRAGSKGEEPRVESLGFVDRSNRPVEEPLGSWAITPPR